MTGVDRSAPRYLFSSITGSIVRTEDAGAEFGALASNFGSIPWHTLGLVIVLLCMSFGVAKGIEKINKFMMPAFFVLFLLLAVQVARLPGASAGYEYMFRPDWSAMLNPKTWVYAMGQAFFSLSLAGSGTVVYGSYLNKDVDILSSAKNVAIFDTLAAILAGIVIIPAVFAYNMAPNSGPGLLFITIPTVIQNLPFLPSLRRDLLPGSPVCRRHFTYEPVGEPGRSAADQISSAA